MFCGTQNREPGSRKLPTEGEEVMRDRNNKSKAPNNSGFFVFTCADAVCGCIQNVWENIPAAKYGTEKSCARRSLKGIGKSCPDGVQTESRFFFMNEPLQAANSAVCT